MREEAGSRHKSTVCLRLRPSVQASYLALHGKWVPGRHPARVQTVAGDFYLSPQKTAVVGSLLPSGAPNL